jgi:hypothetical protein
VVNSRSENASRTRGNLCPFLQDQLLHLGRIRLSHLGKLEDLVCNDLGRGVVAIDEAQFLQHALVGRAHRVDGAVVESCLAQQALCRHWCFPLDDHTSSRREG